jgi:hypothetical protein
MGMDNIDVGTLAARPAPRSSTEGKFYLARDTNELFIQEDGAWELVVDTGAAPASAGTAVVALTQNIAQAIGNGDGVTWFPVEWTDEVSDLLGFHAGGAPEDIVIPAGQGGLYRIDASVTFDGPTGGNDYGIRLTVDGSEIEAIYRAPNNVRDTETSTLPSRIVQLADGDVLNIDVLHNEGAALNSVPAATFASLQQVIALP